MLTPAQERVLKRADDNYFDAPKRIADVLSEGEWRDRRCFIIGGGESLRGFDFNRLAGELTIGINKSFLYYDPTLQFFSDPNFYDLVTKDESFLVYWQALQGYKVCVASMEEHRVQPDVYLIRRSFELVLPQSFNEGINVWNNSGYGALVLAYLLGASPIYLLGFDMKCVHSTHWHCGYAGQTVEKQGPRMHAFMMPFNYTYQQFAEAGTEVINLNPNSALTCFKFDEVTSILR